MNQDPYDPKADEEYTPKHLSHAEDSAVGSTGAPNGETAAESAAGLSSAEQSAVNSSEDTVGRHRDEAAADEPNDTVGKGYTGERTKKSFPGRVRGLSRRQKFFLVGAGTGGGGVIGVLILLLILASSLKIPNLMQNITTYEFARMTRQYSESANRITTEKVAADALDNQTWKTVLKERYQNLRDNTWGKFDSYRPAQVMKNLESEHNFQLNYTTDKTFGISRQRLAGITLGDETHLYIQQSARTRYVPVLSSIVDFKNNVSLAQRVQPGLKSALDAGLRDQDIGPIIRSRVAKQVRQELGISLTAWTLSKFKGKTLDPDAPPKESANVTETEERTATVDKASINGENNAKTDKIKEAVDDGKAAETTAAASDTAVSDAIKAGGIFQPVKDAIGSALKTTGLDTAIGIINPLYSLALPVCIVYDGSLGRSGPTINQQTTEEAATYYHYASAADNLKDGTQTTSPDESTELGLAAGATSDSLGDTNKSNAIIRANGGTVDTSNTLSAEASAGGEYTLLNASGLPTGIAEVINSIGDTVCPILTNTTTAVVIGAGGVVVGIVSGGSEEGVSQAAGDAATSLIEKEAANVTENVFTKLVGKVTTRAGKLLDITKDTAKSAAKVAAITIIAKLVVNARAGQVQSGVSQDIDAANEADAGGNVVANIQEQRQMYGRPLTQSEVAQSDAADQKTIAYQNSSKSMYERYLATDNAQSLLSRLAIDVSGSVNTSIFHSLASVASMLFRPMTYVGAFATSFSGNAHAAAADQHYGNVQFGFSEAEEKLIDATPSYSNYLDNQSKIDAKQFLIQQNPDVYQPAEDYIKQHYDHCFTDQIGDLLSKGFIQRDSDGNVLPDKSSSSGGHDGDYSGSDDFGCAPNSLGPTSPDQCGFLDSCADWIFRYRIEHASDNTVDQLTDDQAVTTDDANGGAAAAPSGDTAQLAQQVLANSNITLSASSKADLTAAAQGQKVTPGPIGNGSSGLPGCSARTPTDLDPELLKVMLTIAQKYQYQINDIVSGHDCDTGQHPLGRAMDIFYIAGQPLNDNWWASSTNVATINDIGNIVHSTNTIQYGFGVGCTAVSKIQDRGNLTVFDDSCNPQDEIHIDVRGAP